MFSIESRGQVGIGTLIVFIAMILVAAVAAGVLINSAGLLQAQAQQTGEETTDQVSNRVVMSTATGEDTSNDGKIDEIQIKITKGSGSDPIDLRKLTYTVSIEDQAKITTIGEDTIGVSRQVNVVTGNLVGANEPGYILEGEGNYAFVVIDLIDSNKFNQVSGGETVQTIIETQDGGTTYGQYIIPDRINKGESYLL